MNSSKSLLGFILGTTLVVFLVLILWSGYKKGEANWYYLVMISGMLLLLYYSVRRPGRR